MRAEIMNVLKGLQIMSFSPTVIGQIAAISTAIFWSIAVILFKKSGESVQPVALNMFKNVFAMILIVPTMYILGDSLTGNFTWAEVILLLVSGALGIGIADTLFFKSLNLLGAGLSAIVDCLYSPSIIILAFFWLGERLAIIQILVLLMILSAVLTVSRTEESIPIPKKDLLWFHPQRKSIIKPRLNRKSWIYLITGSFIGTYVSLVLWLAGMKYTQTSMAAALNQTSNIFIFVFAAIFLKEPITRRRLVGIVLGFAGAIIVVFA